MLGIKTKIFLPLFLLMAIIGVYFYVVWIPKSVEFSTSESRGLLYHTLEVVELQITQDIVKDDMNSVRQNLDLMLLKNPAWKELVLTDNAGKLLYPETDNEDTHNGASILTISQDMAAYGTKIGTLTLQYDFSETETAVRNHAQTLFMLLITALCLFAVVAALIIQFIVIKPALMLTEAAEKFTSEGKESAEPAVLPAITSDQIGKLIRSFAAMREAIINQQKSLKEQNRELTLAKEQAEKANHAKSEFLANMSHELRTPLNSIMGLTRMFTEDPDLSEDNRRMAGTVYKASTSLLDIVNDILDISKIEAGSMVLERIGFDLKGVVSNIIETMAPIASAKGVSLKYQYEHDDLPYLMGDPLRVSRILANLLSNAIKYTDKGVVNVSIDGKRILQTKGEVETFEYNKARKVHILVNSRPLTNNKLELHCLVQDTGIGIPKDKLKMIFDKFTQADESTTRKFGGTGLGLAITKDLVEMMGGKIGVDSEIGKGSTFWFTIPFDTTDKIDEEGHGKARKNRQEKTGDAPQARIPIAKARILVAEDHLLNQDFIKRLLGRKGFEHVNVVDTGERAVEEWGKGTYDLILMDCHMPGKNGYEATQEIRKQESAAAKTIADKKKTGAHIPIVALTADAMKGTQEKCLECGMDEYVTKPIDADELRAVLGQWIIFPEDANGHGETLQQADTGAPVNLALLEEYADTPEDVKRFVQTFIRQSNEGLKILQEHCIDGDSKDWMEAAHKLKGGAGMIGAKKLQTLCAQAQEMQTSTAKKRDEILKEIKNEYAKIKDHMNTALS